MKSFFALLEGYERFWPYAVAAILGGLLAVFDRRVLHRPLSAIALVLVVVGGFIGMNVSTFTFAGGDHYFQSLIAMVAALFALAGYGLVALCRRIFRGNTA